MLIYLRTVILAGFVAACSGVADDRLDTFGEMEFATQASFERTGYVAHFPITNLSGETLIQISCYSLDDEAREEFAVKSGTDPVADLSCYAKDMGRTNEYTMLGINGESLQFTPAFFWFSDIAKCASGSYHLDAQLRGVGFSFSFLNIDVDGKISDMEIHVAPMVSAKNDSLTEQSYRAYCSSDTEG